MKCTNEVTWYQENTQDRTQHDTYLVGPIYVFFISHVIIILYNIWNPVNDGDNITVESESKVLDCY